MQKCLFIQTNSSFKYSCESCFFYHFILTFVLLFHSYQIIIRNKHFDIEFLTVSTFIIFYINIYLYCKKKMLNLKSFRKVNRRQSEVGVFFYAHHQIKTLIVCRMASNESKGRNNRTICGT